MATPAVGYPVGTPGISPTLGPSTKGLHHDDAFAKLIGPDFIDRVDPRKLIIFLPHDTLTDSDEDRIVARQESQGRVEAAKLLLSLIVQRGDWIPRLQQGLRHREIRLEDLADKMDSLQGEVRMEIDFPENAASEALMEVDAEGYTDTPTPQGHPHPHLPLGVPPPPPQAPQPPPPFPQQTPAQMPFAQAAPAFQPPPFHAPPEQVGLPELPAWMMSGMTSGQLSAPATAGQRSDPHAILNQIAQHFFLNLARTPEDVKQLTGCFERIATVMVTGYAFGCLEMRLRVETSRDLLHLRRLVESGVVQDMVEKAALSDKQRAELNEAAAAYGLSWRWMKLKVTIEREDLDRCERFLRAREIKANPRNAAEALLQKVSISEGSTQSTAKDPLPDLLVLFLQSLLSHPLHLVEEVAFVLANRPLDTAIMHALRICRYHHKLPSELMKGLGHVAFDMLQRIAREKAGADETSSEIPEKAEAEGAAPKMQSRQEPGEYTSPYVVVPPESSLAEVVLQLTLAGLMEPCVIPNVEHAFRFVNSFVADRALICIARYVDNIPKDYVSRVLESGSIFVVLHLVDLLLNTQVHGKDLGFQRHELQRNVSSQLLQCMADHERPRTVTDLYLACCSLPMYPECKLFLQRCWWCFGPGWKQHLRVMLESGKPEAIPDILLCPVSHREFDMLSDTAEQILSAKHTMDLTGKLSDLSKPQLRMLLACVQLTNVASFMLLKVGEHAVLRVQQEETNTVVTTSSVGQPALKLCENRLEDRHIECLLDALPGMESVPHFDLSSCTISKSNLQRLLDGLCAESVKTLVLNKISFSDLRTPTLPRFSHLKRLQALELSILRLEDGHMPQLAQQIRELQDLRELSLEENPITTEGLTRLTAALATCSCLRVLRLHGCHLDAGSAFVLGAALMPAVSLHVLNLGDCPLLDSGLQHLSQVLKNHTLLNKVSLRNGRYTPPGLMSFLFHLRKCPRMQVLELGSCPLEEEGMDISEQLIRALAGSCQWHFLGLWQCRIGHTSFLQQLLTLPHQLRGLAILILQDNNIDDTQVGSLTDAMQRGVFRHLKVLNLRQNNIRATGAKQLSDAVRYLPHMSQLLMQHSAVPVSGAVTLALSVLRLPDMTLLDLSDSCGMGHGDVIDAVSEIESIVQNQGVVIGTGVGYPEGDSAFEQSFIAENLQLLSLKDSTTAGGEREGELHPAAEGTAEKASDAEPPSSTPRLPEEGEVSAGKPVEVISHAMEPFVPPPSREGIYEEAGIVSSPTYEQQAPRWTRSRQREITGRERDAVVFNNVLLITLRHQ